MEKPGSDCSGVGFSRKSGLKFVSFRLSGVDASQDGRSGGCKTPQGGVKYRYVGGWVGGDTDLGSTLSLLLNSV